MTYRDYCGFVYGEQPKSCKSYRSTGQLGQENRLTVIIVGLSMVNNPKAVNPIGVLVSWDRKTDNWN